MKSQPNSSNMHFTMTTRVICRPIQKRQHTDGSDLMTDILPAWGTTQQLPCTSSVLHPRCFVHLHPSLAQSETWLVPAQAKYKYRYETSVEYWAVLMQKPFNFVKFNSDFHCYLLQHYDPPRQNTLEDNATKLLRLHAMLRNLEFNQLVLYQFYVICNMYQIFSHNLHISRMMTMTDGKKLNNNKKVSNTNRLCISIPGRP